MTLETLNDLFDRRLRRTYAAERRLVDALERLADDATDDDLRAALADHREETATHVDRLEAVFDALDQEPEAGDAPAVESLAGEKRAFDAEVGDEFLRNLEYAQLGTKIERHELTDYEELLALAERLDLGSDVVDPLDRTLDEEREALRELRTLAEGSGSMLDRLF